MKIQRACKVSLKFITQEKQKQINNLKLGKRKNRGKYFRKILSPWTYSFCISRIESKSQENRVCLVKVNPQNTSRKCPICGYIDKKNRKNEMFCCLQCSYQEDADIVGATNILSLSFLLGV